VSSPLEKNLIGVQLEEDAAFVCRDCITEVEEPKVDDENFATKIFDEDSWFRGDVCTRCGILVNL
jgi:hypothetical protein